MLRLDATHPIHRELRHAYLPRLTLVLALFLAGFMALAQPGLCPCWLMENVAANHPHPDGHPERPHTHGYLFEMFASSLAASPPPAPLQVRLFVAHLASRGLPRLTAPESPTQVHGWRPAVDPPPPRGACLRASLSVDKPAIQENRRCFAACSAHGSRS